MPVLPFDIAHKPPHRADKYEHRREKIRSVTIRKYPRKAKNTGMGLLCRNNNPLPYKCDLQYINILYVTKRNKSAQHVFNYSSFA